MRVNINKKIILSIIIILSITFISTISKAALEFKTTGGYEPNASTAYQLCYDLKNSDSTLGINQVDPHLILAKDWAAVCFLALSTYGKNTNNNIEIGNHYTSNGNYTGVMSTGTAFISAVIETYNSTEDSRFNKLVENKNTKYVDSIKMPITNTNNKGLGLFEGRSNPEYAGENSPIFVTYGNIGYNSVFSCNYNYWDHELFRPAIWNIDR